MARNHKFFFDTDGSPKARGPATEKVFMTFLELDVQGSDYICRDLMDDLTAVEDESDDSRDFIGNAHHVTITAEGVLITPNLPDSPPPSDNPELTPKVSQTHAQPLEQAQTQQGEKAEVHKDAPKEVQGHLVPLKHFREILEDWEAFILDDQLDDPMADDKFL